MNNAHTIPINSTAARVVSKGVHYDIKKVDIIYHDDKPLPFRKKCHWNGSSEFHDYTNHKHGAFVVIGLAKKTNKKRQHARWVVKCSCGQFETRTSAALKNHIINSGKFEVDRCRRCNDLKRLRITASAKAQGYTYHEYCEKLRNEKEKRHESI